MSKVMRRGDGLWPGRLPCSTNTALSELIKANGAGKRWSGIYLHFSSKDELAAEAFDYAWKLTRFPQTFATDWSRLKSKDAKGESHESNSYQH
jgi:hypothetical protein